MVWQTHPSEGCALSFHSLGPRCLSSTMAHAWRQVGLGIHSSIYIHVLVWIQTPVFRLSSVTCICHTQLFTSEQDPFKQNLPDPLQSPQCAPASWELSQNKPPEMQGSAGGKNCCFLKRHFFWQHYLLTQTQPLLPGEKVCLVEPQTSFVTTPLPCTACVGFLIGVFHPPQVRGGQFSVHWYPHNTNQHFLLWKCALPASQLSFLTSPYSQRLILTPDSTLDSERPSGKFSDLDPHLPKTCQSWAGSLGNYKEYDECKSLIICSSSHRNTCRVLIYSSLTFLELHQHFFSYS